LSFRRNGIATAAAISVTTTEQVVELTTVPDVADLVWLHGQITSIVSARVIQWALAYDVAGDNPATSRVGEPIVYGKTTKTKGGVTTRIGREHQISAAGTNGSLWLLIRCDLGSCTLVPELHYKEA